MDILYYSNFCKHSQKLLHTVSKANLADKISFICIDKRSRDTKTNQMHILLENGSKVIMPPNIHSVPALLLIKKNYQVIYGEEEIIQHFQPHITSQNNIATNNNGEPSAFCLGGTANSNIVSEQYTYYNMSPEELSVKGKGGMRQMYNYMSANNDTMFINTPPDNYRPDKLSNNITIDNLQQQRNADINQIVHPNPSLSI